MEASVAIFLAEIAHIIHASEIPPSCMEDISRILQNKENHIQVDKYALRRRYFRHRSKKKRGEFPHMADIPILHPQKKPISRTRYKLGRLKYYRKLDTSICIASQEINRTQARQ